MKRQSGKKKLTAEKVAAMKALANRIDAEEGVDIRRRARAAFARHARLLEIVRKLKDERERRGMTLAELSLKTGIAKPNLSRLENSTRTMPTLDTLSRYAQALGKQIRVELVASRRRAG
jgi:DNA-binding XRE family transcriptional regulator